MSGAVSLEQEGVERPARLGQGSRCWVLEEEWRGGGEWRGESAGELRRGEAINYEVDTFNRGLKSNHLPRAIGRRQTKSTVPISGSSLGDKDCLSENA